MWNFVWDTKNQQFMRLWWAQLISQFGDRLTQMALIGLVAERSGGSAWDLAKLLAFTIFPVFIIGPVAGVFVDRWDRRRTLFICDLLRSGLILLIPFFFMSKEMMIPVYAVVFLIFCFSRFTVPAKMSIIPELVPTEHLLVANSLMTTTGMIAFVLGCAVGGFLVDHIGARGGFFGNALTFFISGAIVFSIRTDLRMRFDRERFVKTSREMLAIERSVWSDMKEGWRYLLSHRELRFIISMLFILLAAAGAVYVVIIVFIQQAFQSVTKDLGILAVMLGIGLFCGTLLYSRWGKKVLWHHTIFFCLILGGIMMALFALIVHQFPSLLLASGLAVLLGMIIGPIFIAANTVVHFVTDETMRGKIFSTLEMVIHFAFLATMLLSSFFAKAVPPEKILIGVGAIFAVVGIAGFIVYSQVKPLEFEMKKVG